MLTATVRVGQCTFSDDFRFIDQAGHSFTRDQEVRECQLPLPPGSKSERVLTSFHCQVKGNLAFLDYRIDETQRRGDTTYTQSFRHLDTFERRKEWTVSHAMQVQIFDDPAIAQVDPTTYGAFVGRYENTAGVVDLVTRRGDKLFAQEAEDDTPTEMLRRVPTPSSSQVTRLVSHSSEIRQVK
ncbi:MAG: nuclear transport factor 2 family protein [Terriglobales bacterium]